MVKIHDEKSGFKLIIDILNKRRVLIGPNFEQGLMMKRVDDTLWQRWYHLFELGLLFCTVKILYLGKPYTED